MNFTVTFTAVGVMLLYAIPGYLFIKSKLISKASIPAFAIVLMYLCQPCLTIYSFTKCTYTKGFINTMLIFFFVSLFLQAAILLFSNLIMKRISTDVRHRVATIATSFGNCGFLGVPLLERLLPDYPEALALSALFFMGMNMLGWTIASSIITNDKKYISIKKVFINPAMFAIVIALPMFFTHTSFPTQINDIISVLAKMTTPLCMLIMGMRLATIPFKKLFNDILLYIIIMIKQLLMPLISLLIISMFPVDIYVKQTMFILCATPIASVVLNFAEMLGEGQETAANLVLLGTSFSIITIPVILLLL